MFFRALFSKFYRILISMKTGIAAGVMLLILALAGSLIPAGYFQPGRGYVTDFFILLGFDRIYQSPLFISVLLILAVNTGLCSISRLPALLKNPVKPLSRYLMKWMLFLIHLSILFLASGGIWESYGSYNAAVELPEDSVAALPEQLQKRGLKSIRLIEFNTELYESGEISDWISTLEATTDQGEILRKEIRVNHPFEYRGITILQTSFSYEYRIRFFKDDGQQSDLIPCQADRPIPLTRDGKIVLLISKPDTSFQKKDPEAPVVIPFRIYSGHEMIYDGSALFQSETELLPDMLRMTVESGRDVSGLTLRYNPGLPLIWLSFLILVISICVYYYLKLREENDVPKASE